VEHRFREDAVRRRANQIFNLQSDSDRSAIKKAYRRLTLKCHPDRNLGDPLAGIKMELIHQAYDLLMKGLSYGEDLRQYSLLMDDELVRSILPEDVEPEPLTEPYYEWHRKRFYKGYFY